jgi:cellulose synthase/poly-beta-1,6-N-acetylglucosamine synthase-like glycosyltransferase
VSIFSVVVPNRDSLTVAQTLKGLEQQSLNRWRYDVVIVGTDRHGVVRESPGVRFDRSDRALSPAQARNRGAARAIGDVLVFIDADCVPHTDWLSVLAERFVDSQVAVVGGGVAFERGNYWTVADNLSMFHDYMIGSPAGTRQQLPSLNLAVRRAVFHAIGGFDERYPRAAGEDADLTIRLRRSGYTLHFEPNAVVLHRPPRSRLSDLLRHGFYQGKYSTKIDPRYRRHAGLPWPLHTRLGILVSSPILSAAVAARICATDQARAYWRTFPAIWIAKLAWCVGAAFHPPGGVRWGT